VALPLSSHLSVRGVFVSLSQVGGSWFVRVVTHTYGAGVITGSDSMIRASVGGGPADFFSPLPTCEKCSVNLSADDDCWCKTC
jgi:hypothetical protein